MNSAEKGNLPAEPNPFVGRERDVEDLRTLLEGMRSVTLCGAGGIGKTRLAVRVAHALRGAYADGVWFVELGDLAPDGPPGAVAGRVAAVLGLPGEDGGPQPETLAGTLRDWEALLVLDNCEHLVGDCAALTGTLLARCPRLRVLATSREPLRTPVENVWRVPPLEPGEAARLFEERARAARPGFTGGRAVEEIARALDGVPLALELAAARVRVLSAEQIAERLADRFRLLNAGDRTAPPRQRTLRAAIDWSHELLGEGERLLLRRLSVFSGWTLEQAERVCAGGPLRAEEVLDLLTALADKSLVVVGAEVAGEIRFRMLDIIRRYAAERLEEAGERDALRGRHRDAMLELAERHGEIGLAGRPAPWDARVRLFRRYDAELGNVREALAWSLESGGAEEGLRICTALRTYWIVRGRSAEWAEWADRFLARCAAAPASVRGPALAGRAQLAAGGRDASRAREFAEAALAPCREAGDAVMAATALITLAEAHTVTGRPAEAEARLDEADALTGEPGQEWNRAYASIARGYLRIRQGRLREAREPLESGLRIMRELGQLWGAAHALIGLGRLAEARGDRAAARARYEEALPPLREIGARPEIARALAGVGRIALAQGDPAAAREALTGSLLLARATGVRLDAARVLDTFAELVAREGDPRRAVLLGGAAAGLRDAAGRCAGGGRFERRLEPIRRKLGAPLVAQLWGEGRALPLNDAVAQAVSVPGPRVPETAPERHPERDPERSALPSPAAVPVTPPATLTAREREIAALVARGLSNRGIAEELVISPATVARHVTNILTKLGFGSRAQVAAWAVEQLGDPRP
ncbi:helix-turn-helix transcriptional regulator [Actinomadura viridis]|uniref:ATPase/DNA-binding CsgD family transcriptional regulator n=1 Tax=Actinomadura viridis TaxID=58110 RepID=A0A931GPR3_9ACTN|nr:LuxR C-terminal-related transcriptional regulator [Actinomadura viridis]MBG6090891.1 putative ATPase/DNA-binding CsgD family transcriptional regulator [Actinomadura viridis]